MINILIIYYIIKNKFLHRNKKIYKFLFSLIYILIKNNNRNKNKKNIKKYYKYVLI
jgi:hypothetical protein